ncbi:MAG: hypothetical protein E7401_04625 [Ruminococcaceae bacterium]|nr:hypothetical protein [Oscillospiraceae bacterium]
MLFYGSSITQGGCASRPGTCYPSIISRKFNTNIHNFGFSSGGCGDKNICFIDGYSLFGEYGHDACTVDSIHPNDLGLWRMAEVIGGVIEPFLK